MLLSRWLCLTLGIMWYFEQNFNQEIHLVRLRGCVKKKKKIKICNFNFKDNEKYNDIAGFTDFIPSTYGY